MSITPFTGMFGSKLPSNPKTPYTKRQRSEPPPVKVPSSQQPKLYRGVRRFNALKQFIPEAHKKDIPKQGQTKENPESQKDLYLKNLKFKSTNGILFYPQTKYNNGDDLIIRIVSVYGSEPPFYFSIFLDKESQQFYLYDLDDIKTDYMLNDSFQKWLHTNMISINNMSPAYESVYSNSFVPLKINETDISVPETLSPLRIFNENSNVQFLMDTQDRSISELQYYGRYLSVFDCMRLKVQNRLSDLGYATKQLKTFFHTVNVYLKTFLIIREPFQISYIKKYNHPVNDDYEIVEDQYLTSSFLLDNKNVTLVFSLYQLKNLIDPRLTYDPLCTLYNVRYTNDNVSQYGTNRSFFDISMFNNIFELVENYNSYNSFNSRSFTHSDSYMMMVDAIYPMHEVKKRINDFNEKMQKEKEKTALIKEEKKNMSVSSWALNAEKELDEIDWSSYANESA